METKFLEKHIIIINLCKRATGLNGSTYLDCWFNIPSSFNLAQAIFDTLDKSTPCSPKREQKFVLLVALDRWDYRAYIDMEKFCKKVDI